MALIEISNLYKRYKKVVAINRIGLSVEKGEMLTLLGPSGCGKTTTLRCIAGLEKPQEGDIVIDEKSMLSQGFVPPSKRGIGMVFQNYAVWPHMKVFNNVVYGLKLQKTSKSEIPGKSRTGTGNGRVGRFGGSVPVSTERRPTTAGCPGARHDQKPQGAPFGRTIEQSGR